MTHFKNIPFTILIVIVITTTAMSTITMTAESTTKLQEQRHQALRVHHEKTSSFYNNNNNNNLRQQAGQRRRQQRRQQHNNNQREGSNIKISNSSLLLPPSIISQYGLDRPNQWLGSTPAYNLVNTHNHRVSQRRIEMKHLEDIKNGPCGNFPPSDHNTSSPWSPVTIPDFSSLTPSYQYNQLHFGRDYTSDDWMRRSMRYCESSQKFRRFFRARTFRDLYEDWEGCENLNNVGRWVCEADHPGREGVRVSMERMGPFRTTGGYSWTSLFSPYIILNIANLTSHLSSHPTTTTSLGGLSAPISPNGTLLPYPPLHIHHSHIYPYGSRLERKEKIRWSERDDHDLLFQSHGETACDEDDGGLDCLLNILDEEGGGGYKLWNVKTGLNADWDVNDVREEGSEPLEWYFEIVVLHKQDDDNDERVVNNKSENDGHTSNMNEKEPADQQQQDKSNNTTTTSISHPKKYATYLGLNNPCIGRGPCTYAMPYDPHSNLLFYQYQHDATILQPGILKNWVLHTHMHFADSVFLFAEQQHRQKKKVKRVKGVLDEFVEGVRKDGGHVGGLPLILDCYNHTLESAKRAILEPLMDMTTNDDDVTLVCEMTKPSLHFECHDDDDDNCVSYDRRSHLNCLDELPINDGDILTVIAFNRVRPHRRQQRTHYSSIGNDNSNDERVFGAFQHSIIRADLISEERRRNPPAFFHFGEEDMVDNVSLELVDLLKRSDCWNDDDDDDGWRDACERFTNEYELEFGDYMDRLTLSCPSSIRYAWDLKEEKEDRKFYKKLLEEYYHNNDDDDRQSMTMDSSSMEEEYDSSMNDYEMDDQQSITQSMEEDDDSMDYYNYNMDQSMTHSSMEEEEEDEQVDVEDDDVLLPSNEDSHSWLNGEGLNKEPDE